MANTLSAKKRIRQNAKRRARNKKIVSRTRTNIKLARQSIENADVPKAEAAVKQAISDLDRAASSGVFHPENAARRKSRLMARLNALKNKA